ncbi:hypothetical protein [Luteimonas sp. e5]
MLNYASLRPLFEPFGELRPQAASEWTGREVLPQEVATFYLEVGPWGETYHANVGPVGSTLTVGGNPVCIPPLHKLADLQAGYAWSRTPDNPLQGWGRDWLVVADQGGDPFIFDCSSGRVLFDHHGSGRWNPQVFAENLYFGLGGVATVASAFLNLGEEEHFEDCELKPSGREIITLALTDFLGERSKAEHMLSVWRYYQ